MKCPKCGYHSFEHLDNCKKCSHDLSEHKSKYNLRGFISVGGAAPAEAPTAADVASIDTAGSSEADATDFGFDFLDEEEDQADEAPAKVPLGEEPQGLSLDQPFGVDSETIPADTPAEKDNKPGKDPEFSL
jgi:hypothetical protein